MNEDVIRLRRLRRTALRTRALATVLDDRSRRSPSLIERGAVLSWRIARISSGKLRSHPNPRFHREQGSLDTIQDGFAAISEGLFARKREQRLSAFTAQLKVLAQQLDDTRALTLTPDLSDTLGRAQVHMRELLADCARQARLEQGIVATDTDSGVADHKTTEHAISPYLAL
jgi:hypothetical protein